MKKITLKLNGTAPQKLSLKQLADYLKPLSDMLGVDDQVYLKSITKGSACLNVMAEEAQYSKVLSNIRELSSKVNTDKKVSLGYQKLQDLMSRDKFDGILLAEKSPILYFPKVSEDSEMLIIIKKTSIQGELYVIGGKDETVPVKLSGSNNETLKCNTNRVLAQKLAQYLYKIVRLSGDGKWGCNAEGKWELKMLQVHSFEPLKRSTLRDSIEELNTIGGNLWSEMENPHLELLNMGEDE